MGMNYETIQDSSNARVTSLLLWIVFFSRDSTALSLRTEMSIFFTGDNFFQKSQQPQLRLFKQWYYYLSTDTLKPNIYTSRCGQEMSQKWLSVCSGKIKISCWAFLDGYPVRILKISYQDMNQKCKTDQTNHIPFLQDLTPICTQKYNQLLNFQVHTKNYVWFISGWLLDTYRLGLWVGVGQMVLIKTTLSQAFFLKFKIAEKWTFFMSAFAFFAACYSKCSSFGTNQDTDFKPTSNGHKSPISDISIKYQISVALTEFFKF